MNENVWKNVIFFKNLCIGYVSVNNFLNNTDMFKKLCNSLDR